MRKPITKQAAQRWLRVKLALYWLDDMAADHAAAEFKESWPDRVKRRIWEIERTERIRAMLNPPNGALCDGSEPPPTPKLK